MRIDIGVKPDCVEDATTERCHRGKDREGHEVVIIPRIPLTLDFSPNAATPYVYRFTSKYDSSLSVDQDNWVVTHLNTNPESSTGHAMIIVESCHEFQTDEGRYDRFFQISYCDIRVRSGWCSLFSRTATVFIEEYNHYHHFFNDSIPTANCYRRPKNEVNRMLDYIRTNKGQDVKYFFAGNRSYLYSACSPDHNCLTWTYAMLELSNINVVPSLHDRLKATPSHYFGEAHAQ